MRYALAFIVLVGTLAGSLAWPQTAPATSKKKTAAKKSAKSTKTVRSTKSSKAGKSGKATHRTTVTPARQMAPTPERYKEIQQALVDKGYLKSEPSGVWDADSADAMTRFQNDRKLPVTGKLTAASLIALGLGPKRAAAASPAAPIQGESAPPAADSLHATGEN